MHPGLHRTLLRGFRLLPVRARRRIVRTIAPSFTAGSMCFIERPDGALLLVRHVYRQRWGVPGGLMERGEGAADAGYREVSEEVGIDIVLVGEPAVVVDPEPQRIDVVFRARVAPGSDWRDARPVSPEIAEVGWFAPQDLPELQHETAGAFVALARARGGDVDRSAGPLGGRDG